MTQDKHKKKWAERITYKHIITLCIISLIVVAVHLPFWPETSVKPKQQVECDVEFPKEYPPGVRQYRVFYEGVELGSRGPGFYTVNGQMVGYEIEEPKSLEQKVDDLIKEVADLRRVMEEMKARQD